MALGGAGVGLGEIKGQRAQGIEHAQIAHVTAINGFNANDADDDAGGHAIGGLGPGEVVDLEADTRAPRAARFPDPIERFPQRAGSAVITTIQNTLPGAVTTGELLATSSTLPTLPSDPTDGPRMLVCGKIAVYPSD